ncbi:hypothetical protein [Bacillus fonticola]|uniref:hypothetical protein n=1 Tax=Bacillus fonticola TaxID=2728853 RepID=UPI0014734939|nr:hypothetical protein [Bacillus fonticola]
MENLLNNDEVLIEKSLADEILKGGEISDKSDEFFRYLSNSLIFGKGGLAIKLSKLNLDINETKEVAIKILNRLIPYLIEYSAPKNISLEVDKEQKTVVREEGGSRTLLPHHDGGHCSYLTPSVIDVPEWDTKYRVFSNKNFYTTHMHKIIQGILILNPGEQDSITTYYDWIQILEDAYRYQHSGKMPSIVDLQKWLGSNIQYSLNKQNIHNNKYLNMAAALGAKDLMYHTLSLHSTSEKISEDILRSNKKLSDIQQSCACQMCNSNILRVLCHVLKETMGISYEEFIHKYEKKVYSEQLDLVIGNNLSLLHGGFNGGSERLILPMCIVLEETSDISYERYLKNLWNRNRT